MPETGRKRLLDLTAAENRLRVRQRWQVDLYVIDGANRERWNYFLDIFPRNPDAG
ncbi:MAG: hypothetical protein OXE83_10305 [Gammaproteobacteria bacterium]|nr:hypothetical protein [Gammaproteobacteria bacterium]